MNIVSLHLCTVQHTTNQHDTRHDAIMLTLVGVDTPAYNSHIILYSIYIIIQFDALYYTNFVIVFHYKFPFIKNFRALF